MVSLGGYKEQLDLLGLEERKQGTRSRQLLAELRTCGKTRNLERGKRIHADAVETGDAASFYVATALVKMYSYCGSMADAHRVFDSIKYPDVVSWTALISGYARNGQSVVALNLYARMKSQGCAPDSFTFVSVIKACTSLALVQDGNGRAACLRRGKQIHMDIGCHLSLFVQNTLIEMYAKCGSMDEARKVFEAINQPDVVSWNTLMLGYAERGKGALALDLFLRMKSQGYQPTSFTYVAALKGCSSLALESDGKTKCLEQGKRVHSEIGCHSNIYVQSSLIDMYVKGGSTCEARQVFDSMTHKDVLSWSTLMLGYAENGEAVSALDLYFQMRLLGCAPDSFTFVAALKACTLLALEQDKAERAWHLELGRRIHSEIGCHLDSYVQSSLIDMYSKCGSMVDARKIFDAMKHQDVVTWTSLISGYAENGQGVTALDLFAKMRCVPDSITLLAALKACGQLGALEAGRTIHAQMEDTGTEPNVNLVTGLVDFYAKCGSVVEARKIFDLHARTRDLTTWNALLGGYSRLGDKEAAFGLFEAMRDTGVCPDDVTFLCILACCSHTGQLEKAGELFEAMSSYRIAPNVEHYNCMLDILGRSNKLDAAIALLRSMPCRPSEVSWMTVLSACRKCRNVGIGKLAFESMVSLDSTNAAAHVLMTDIYGSRGMWDEQDKVLALKSESKSR